jgi:hypothetical protein
MFTSKENIVYLIRNKRLQLREREGRDLLRVEALIDSAAADPDKIRQQRAADGFGGMSHQDPALPQAQGQNFKVVHFSRHIYSEKHNHIESERSCKNSSQQMGFAIKYPDTLRRGLYLQEIAWKHVTCMENIQTAD